MRGPFVWEHGASLSKHQPAMGFALTRSMPLPPGSQGQKRRSVGLSCEHTSFPVSTSPHKPHSKTQGSAAADMKSRRDNLLQRPKLRTGKGGTLFLPLWLPQLENLGQRRLWREGVTVSPAFSVLLQLLFKFSNFCPDILIFFNKILTFRKL